MPSAVSGRPRNVHLVVDSKHLSFHLFSSLPFWSQTITLVGLLILFYDYIFYIVYDIFFLFPTSLCGVPLSHTPTGALVVPVAGRRVRAASQACWDLRLWPLGAVSRPEKRPQNSHYANLTLTQLMFIPLAFAQLTLTPLTLMRTPSSVYQP